MGARARRRRAHGRLVGARRRHGPHARCGRCRPGGAAAAGATRVNVEEGVELARFTTLGTGGPARAFARPESVAEVEELLRWAAEQELGVATVGLGSNLLAADEGVDALVLKLGGNIAAVASAGTLGHAAGGPATIGGGVWMNGGACGSDFAQVLERALVATAEGSGQLTPAELGLSYRHSNLGHGQVVVSAELRLSPRDPVEIKHEIRES